MPLPQTLYDKAFDLLIPYTERADERQAMIQAALHGHDLYDIEWDGAARPFTRQLTSYLDRFGMGDVYLLKVVMLKYRDEIGLQKQIAIDSFLQELDVFLAGVDPKTYVSRQKPVDSSLRATTSKPVFISYSRVDTQFAHDLYLKLEALGFKLWRDRTDMEIGEDWWPQIEAAIESSVTMVLCLSPAALASPVVKEEWLHARRKGIRVMPVITADVDFQTAPRWMTRTDWADFRPGAKEADLVWGRFIHQLNSPYQPAKTPFMAPKSEAHFVSRPAEMNQIIGELVDDIHGAKVAQVALHGTGGFGKTTLAITACHDQRVRDAFDDGILWVKLGEKPSDLISKINNLVFMLTGTSPDVTDLDAARAKLVEALGEHHILMVIDDVWDKADLQPFLDGGPNCARLITTRNLNTLARSAIKIPIRAMSEADALRLISKDLNDASAEQAQLQELSNRLGCWPLIIKVANALLFNRQDHPSLSQALTFMRRALSSKGFDYLIDPENQNQRDNAISAVLSTSLEQLAAYPGWHELYNKMAVLPGSEGIPEPLLYKLWETDDIDTATLCQHLHSLSLIEGYMSNTIWLNDVIVEWLRQKNTSQLLAWREAFIINAAEFVHESINSDALLDAGWQPIYQAMMDAKPDLDCNRNPALCQAISHSVLDYWEHSRFLERRGYLQEGEAVLRVAAHLADTSHSRREWVIHEKNLANVYEMRGQLTQAIDLLKTLIPIAKDISDWHLESKLTANIGNNVLQQYTVAGCEDALQHYTQALDIINQNLPDEQTASVDDLLWKGTVLGNQGMALGGFAYFAGLELEDANITPERRSELEAKIPVSRIEAMTVCTATQKLVAALYQKTQEDSVEHRKVQKLENDNLQNLAQIISQTADPQHITYAKAILRRVIANARQRGDRHREGVALVGILEPLKKQDDQDALKEACNYIFGILGDLPFEGYAEDAGDGAIKVNTATGSVPELRNLLRDFLPHFAERLFAEGFQECACRMIQAADTIANKPEFDRDEGIDALRQRIRDLRERMGY